jgi:hypothetical protein
MSKLITKYENKLSVGDWQYKEPPIGNLFEEIDPFVPGDILERHVSG